MATIRSREISAALVLQAKSQLKAIYKDNADTIIGNCDSQIFLGGSEQTTLKDLKLLLVKRRLTCITRESPVALSPDRSPLLRNIARH